MRTKAGLGLGLALALAAMAASAADHAVLNLEAQASLEVAQDLGRAALYAEKEAQSASEAQGQVNYPGLKAEACKGASPAASLIDPT